MKIGRRIVTGNGPDGRSHVILMDEAETNGRFFSVWRTHGMPVPLQRPETVAALPPAPLAASHGTAFTLVEIPPVPAEIDPEALERAFAEAFARGGMADMRGDTDRHPGMHVTPTLDYIIVLKGELTLLLGSEAVELRPLDIVIQRATDHAWVNTGAEPAILAAVVLDARGSRPE